MISFHSLGLKLTKLIFSPTDEVTSIINKNNDYVLFYGHIEAYKGLDVLFNSIKYVEKLMPNIKVIVAGNGSIDIYNEIKKDLHFNIIDRYLTEGDIVTLVKNCRCVVCPYKSASQTGIIPTVFPFLKPIIATNVGAFPEIIINEFNGLIVEPENHIEFANAIIRIYDDKVYSRLIDGIKKTIYENETYKWNNIGSKFLKILHNNSSQKG